MNDEMVERPTRFRQSHPDASTLLIQRLLAGIWFVETCRNWEGSSIPVLDSGWKRRIVLVYTKDDGAYSSQLPTGQGMAHVYKRDEQV